MSTTQHKANSFMKIISDIIIHFPFKYYFNLSFDGIFIFIFNYYYYT